MKWLAGALLLTLGCGGGSVMQLPTGNAGGGAGSNGGGSSGGGGSGSNGTPSTGTPGTGSGGDGGANTGTGDPSGPIGFGFPPAFYTGYDGTHTYQVPLWTPLPNPTWTSMNPAIATIMPIKAPPDGEGLNFAMVTTKAPGTAGIMIQSGTMTATTSVVVVSYTAAQWTAGDKRYHMPDNSTTLARVACASCHESAAGADHSPNMVAPFSDAEITTAITTGRYPDGYMLMGVDHHMNLTAAEKDGIMAYLRALKPKGF